MSDKAVVEGMSAEHLCRQKFEESYPVTQYRDGPPLEVTKAIHYGHLKREWEAFQKGWQAYAGELREERDALKRIVEECEPYKTWNDMRLRAERAESVEAEALELLGVMYGWAKYGEESDHWYYSEEQAPGWKADSERASKLLGFKLKAKP